MVASRKQYRIYNAMISAFLDVHASCGMQWFIGQNNDQSGPRFSPGAAVCSFLSVGQQFFPQIVQIQHLLPLQISGNKGAHPPVFGVYSFGAG